MTEDDDTQAGGDEGLTIEQAAAAFAKSQAEAVSNDHAEAEDDNEGVEADDELQDSDEDESDEDGEPEDDDHTDEEDEDESEESESGRFIAHDGRVKLSDGSVTTVNELIRGNLREQDYTRKTTELSQERKALEGQSSALKASQDELQQQRDYMVELMRSIMPQPPSPSMADPNSPDFDIVAYNHQAAQHQAFMQHIQYMNGQREQTKHQADQKTATERQAKATEEWSKLLERRPDLKDQAKASTFVQNIAKAGREAGYSQEELQDVLPYDHRAIVILDKAAKWDRLQASKPKAKEKVNGKPPVQRGGKRMTPDAQKSRKSQDAMKRLQESGTVEDAAAAWLATQR